MKKILLPFLFIGILSISLFSCEKKNVSPDEGEETDEITAEEWLLMDSTYYYFSAFSLWADDPNVPIPQTNADIRNFTKSYTDAEEVLEALVAYTPKIGPLDSKGNPTPVDRYSFIDRAGQVGEEIGQGLHRDIGLSLQLLYLSSNSNELGLFIRLVQKNSPSETAGLTRGLQILSVDGTTLNLSVNTDGEVEGNIDVANRLFTGDVSSVKVRNWNTESESIVNLPNTTSYTLDPIIKNLVFEVGNKKVGYIAYTSFISVLTNRQPNRFHNDLTTAFDQFATNGINELIVDLRYNGGGSTNAAELLTNLIVPTGNNGKVMYEYTLNKLLSSIPSFRNSFSSVNINKTNALSLTRVYFLVTSSSASASELVINNLKPYMDVQIISTNNRGTYGKPVGSFGYPVVNEMADLYITSFKMVNAEGQGDYYTGLAGNKQDARDNILTELGTPQEGLLNQALYHIANGSYSSTSQQARISRGGRTVDVPKTLDVNIDKTVQGLYNLDQKLPKILIH